MRFEIDSSFGYPVLRPESDDYIESAIQSSMNVTIDADVSEIEISFQIRISVPEIKELIDLGIAKLFIYCECRDTWFDSIYAPTGYEGQFKLSKKEIDGQLVLTCLVVCGKNIKDFYSVKFNPEYGEAKFNLSSGDIIAYDNPQSFFISRDALKNITSLFDYAENNNISIGEWDITLDDARIKIDVHPSQLPILRSAEATARNKSVLLSGIFLPLLIHILNVMDNDSGELSDFHWFQVIHEKRSALGASISRSPIRAAQALLRQPLGRLNTNMGWLDEN